MRTRVIVSSLLVLACSPVPIPAVTQTDAYGIDGYRSDMGAIVAPPDANVHDGASFDTNSDTPDTNSDMNLPDYGLPDSGIAPPAIVVDGMFTDAIWSNNSNNPVQTNAAPNDAATSPFDGDVLTNFYYARDHDWLYLGFDGALASASDAIVVYVDTAVSPPNGVYLTSMGLMDRNGTVNAVLSNPITGTLEFQPEWGWGTSAMPLALTSGDPRLGWRVLSSTGSFTLTTSSTRSMCSATACETYISLHTLGIDTSVTPPSPITLIVRMGRPDPVGFAIPTFPPADRQNPQVVGTVTVSVAVSM